MDVYWGYGCVAIFYSIFKISFLVATILHPLAATMPHHLLLIIVAIMLLPLPPVAGGHTWGDVMATPLLLPLTPVTVGHVPTTLTGVVVAITIVIKNSCSCLLFFLCFLIWTCQLFAPFPSVVIYNTLLGLMVFHWLGVKPYFSYSSAVVCNRLFSVCLKILS